MSSRYDRLVLERIAFDCFSLSRADHAAEAHCQVNRGINTIVFQKSVRDCNSEAGLSQFLCKNFKHIIM